MEAQDKPAQIGTYSIREFDFDIDYNDYADWIHHFAKRGGKCPSKEQLSTKGLIVESREKLCAGFLYISNSSIAFIEFVCANPKANREKRKEATKILLTQLEELAYTLGYNYILVMTNNSGFSNTLVDKCGYLKGAKSIEHYKVLWQ